MSINLFSDALNTSRYHLKGIQLALHLKKCGICGPAVTGQVLQSEPTTYHPASVFAKGAHVNPGKQDVLSV